MTEESTPRLAINFTHQGQHQEIGEGIYFGMPEKLYHAIPALSASGMKNILVSAPDFYFNSWLNPLREEDAEDDDAKEWQKFGRASHTRILEGKKVFDDLYCVEFLAPEGCLDTVADLKSYCSVNGIDTKGSSKWAKPDWVSQVKFHNPHVLILDIEKEKYYRETGGKVQLSQKDMRRIEIAAAMIEKHPHLQHAFTGGHAEVSVVWLEDGLWFKARFDYLKPHAIVDLKTFRNMKNKPLDGPHGGVLYEVMAGLKYHIQAYHYTRAGVKAIEFARKGITTTYSAQRFGPDPDFLKALAAASDIHEFFFVFQKKGGAPLARGKKFMATGAMMDCARASIERAISLFRKYSEMYGEEIWVDDTPITDFDDIKFPAYAVEL